MIIDFDFWKFLNIDYLPSQKEIEELEDLDRIMNENNSYKRGKLIKKWRRKYYNKKESPTQEMWNNFKEIGKWNKIKDDLNIKQLKNSNQKYECLIYEDKENGCGICIF